MQANGYATWLRSFQALEQRNNRDYTEQALEAYRIRIDSIDRMDVPDARKVALKDAAYRQWIAFMKRDMPAVG